MKQYRCLYNHELLIAFITQSHKLHYTQDVTDEYIRSFVEELQGTQVDCLMLCPTAWRAPLWRGVVDNRWENEDYSRPEPGCWTDLKFYERAYWRIRRYMKSGKDPVAITIDSVRKQGLDFFISYRMNDHHYVWDQSSPLHGKWEIEHPEFSIDPSIQSVSKSYFYPEVRAHYLELLTELCVSYQPAGIELDFMRSPPFFKADQFSGGAEIITDFIRQVKDMLKQVGARCGKDIQLCVRVPGDLDRCRAIALDPVQWDREKLVEMLNVSPNFCSSIAAVRIAEFKNEIRYARIYGENCHHTGKSVGLQFNNNILRKCTIEQYRTASHAFLSQGADGISFFNFAYHRDNCLGDPRRRAFPGVEPRFDLLKNILDVDFLDTQPKHYYLCKSDMLPKEIGQLKKYEFPLTIFSRPQQYDSALIKIETEQNLWEKPLDVCVNGIPLKQTFLSGELFEPDTFEGMTPREKSLIYRVPMQAIKEGENIISLANNSVMGWVTDNFLTCTRIELALYKKDP